MSLEGCLLLALNAYFLGNISEIAEKYSEAAKPSIPKRDCLKEGIYSSDLKFANALLMLSMAFCTFSLGVFLLFFRSMSSFFCSRSFRDTISLESLNARADS